MTKKECNTLRNSYEIHIKFVLLLAYGNITEAMSVAAVLPQDKFMFTAPPLLCLQKHYVWPMCTISPEVKICHSSVLILVILSDL